MIIIVLFLILWPILGYYSLQDTVRRTTGDMSYSPNVGEVLLYMVASVLAQQAIKDHYKHH